MGLEERKEMLARLDVVSRDLKEQKWKLGEIAKGFAQLSQFLQYDRLADALAVLENPEKKVDVDLLSEALRVVLRLQAEKSSLEKQLDVTFMSGQQV